MDDGRASSGEGVQTGVSAGQRAGIRTGRHWLVFFGIAVTIVVLDQLTKAVLVANLDPGQIVSVVGDYIRLVFSQNSGALFGLFRDQAILFAIASLGRHRPDRGLPRAVRAEPVPVDRARASARRRDRQHDRPPSARLRRRLRRHRHRRVPLVHLQPCRRGHQHGARDAVRCRLHPAACQARRADRTLGTGRTPGKRGTGRRRQGWSIPRRWPASGCCACPRVRPAGWTATSPTPPASLEATSRSSSATAA